MPRVRITEQDSAAWAAYARLVRPLPGRQAPALPPEVPIPAAPAPAISAPAPPARTSAALGALVTGIAPGGLDAASWSRLRTGQMRPQLRLDLHGMTLEAAFYAVRRAVIEGRGRGLRCIEIVTGHGRRTGGGVIYRELPHWLNLPALRPSVLAATHPGDNPGATLVLLRRRK
jgi:DNA-nicking Smr family endonuclease